MPNDVSRGKEPGAASTGRAAEDGGPAGYRTQTAADAAGRLRRPSVAFRG